MDLLVRKMYSNYIIKCCACRDLSYNQLSGSFPFWVTESGLQLYVQNCMKLPLFHFQFSTYSIMIHVIK